MRKLTRGFTVLVFTTALCTLPLSGCGAVTSREAEFGSATGDAVDTPSAEQDATDSATQQNPTEQDEPLEEAAAGTSLRALGRELSDFSQRFVSENDGYTQTNDQYEPLFNSGTTCALITGSGTYTKDGVSYPAFCLTVRDLGGGRVSYEFTNMKKESTPIQGSTGTVDFTEDGNWGTCFYDTSGGIDSYEGVSGHLTITDTDTGEVLGEGDFTIK